MSPGVLLPLPLLAFPLRAKGGANWLSWRGILSAQKGASGWLGEGGTMEFQF